MADLGPIVSARILGEVGQDVVGIVESARQRLIRDIERGIADGLGAAQLADLIEQSSAFGSYRSEVIARTETNRALNLAQVERYKEFGVKLVKVYDGDDDEECRERQSRDNGWGPGIYTVEEAANIRDHPNGTMDWSPITLTQEPNVGQAPPAPPAPPSIPDELSLGELNRLLAESFPDIKTYGLEAVLPELRAEIARSLSRLARQFPDAPLQRLYVLTPKEAKEALQLRGIRGAIAAVPDQNGSAVMILNKSVWGNKKRWQSTLDAFAQDAKFHPQSLKAESVADAVISHEFGHVVDNVLFWRHGSLSRPGQRFPLPSEYGMKNGQERWAEAFSEYALGKDTPSARWVAEAMRLRLEDPGALSLPAGLKLQLGLLN